MQWTWRNLLIAIVIFLGFWTLLAAAVNRDIVPYPWEVIPVFLEKFFIPAETRQAVVPDFRLPIPIGELGQHFFVSAYRVLTAIVVAVLLAAPIGLGLGQVQHLNTIFAPLIALTHPIPKIVFLPVMMVLLGSGDLSKIVLIALILFFQILVMVRDEALGLRPELILSVRSLGAGRRALFRFVYIPASLPAILTALRVSVGTAIAVLFVAETYATRSGLGYYIVVRTWQALRYEEMYAGILAMSLLGLLLYFAIDTLERYVTQWRNMD